MIYRSNDTLLGGENDELSRCAAIMGYDINDPEQLHGFIKKIIGKIKTRVQARRAERAAAPAETGGTPGEYSITTPSGKISLQDSSASPSAQSVPAAPVASSNAQSGLMKNPMLLVGAAAVVLFLLTQKK